MDIPNWLTIIIILSGAVGHVIYINRTMATTKTEVKMLKEDFDEFKRIREKDMDQMKLSLGEVQKTLHNIELILAAKFGTDYISVREQ